MPDLFDVDVQPDKDGLIFSHDLEVVPHPKGEPRYVFRLKRGGTTLFPSPEISGVLDLVVHDPTLWSSARIRLSSTEWRQKRLPIFGPSFPTALKAALSQGFVKSRFSLPGPDQLAGSGLVAHLVVHLAKVGLQQDTLMMKAEIWEPLGEEGEVFYVHGVFNADSTRFVHVDGAVIWFAKEDLKSLIDEGKKLKGLNYQKLFRLDGNLPMGVAVEMIRRFLPVSELVAEYLVEVAA